MRLEGDAATAAALAAFALVAALPWWLGDRRPAPPELRAPYEFVVTSAADAGPGSLREALLDADRAPGRARVVLAVPRVTLEDPLPALVNPEGVVLDGGDAGCEIDARRAGDALVVAAPDSVVRGVTIRGAAGAAVSVLADRARLAEVAIEGCGEGVRTAPGVRGLTIEDSRFSGNGVGVRLAAAGPGTAIRRNRFERHDDAAVWAVAARSAAAEAAGGLEVRGNRFVEDRVSLVLADVPATVEDNELVGAFEVAVYLIGRGAIVRGNRIRGAVKVGVYGARPIDALVAGNELDRNPVAILISGAEGTVVRGNRLHANVDGIAAVFDGAGGDNLLAGNLLVGQRHDALLVIGASPLVRGNRALFNQGAGLRLLDAEAAPAAPRLENNVLAGNGVEGPLREAFRAAVEEDAP
ncbi:MAG TPA: right-handed parallel beta-helix repeat-containing protein [Thermoanaerobaculia bacterium]